MSKPASTSPIPSAIACSGVPLRAPSNIESTVTLTIPAADRPGQIQSQIAKPPFHRRYGSERPMSLRCVYTDLDGTLLGQGGALFLDREGNFSMAQARALEACARAGVEVVIMSGRREPQVHEAARLMGQRSYIFEAGCAFAIDGETTLLTGEMQPDEYEGTVYEQIERRGIPAMLFEHFEGRLEYHSPWHHGRVHSHLFRGKVDVDEANALLGEHGDDDLRFLDNGAIGTPMKTVEGQTHAYHLVPRTVSKAAAVAAHARAQRLRPRGVHRGRRLGRGPRGRRLGRPLLRRRQRPRARTPACAPTSRSFDNVTVTEGTNGDGFYEAVVSALMDR